MVIRNSELSFRVRTLESNLSAFREENASLVRLYSFFKDAGSAQYKTTLHTRYSYFYFFT